MKNEELPTSTKPTPLDSLSKRCVFCGELPTEKTSEHVLPLWLIKLTGNQNRVANHGVRWAEGLDALNSVNFAFDRLHFPACNRCNNQYANLEAQTESIVLRLLNELPITSTELDTLLDWFDKVRIGLWLGTATLGTSLTVPIVPKFFITERIRASDRALLITALPTSIDNGLGYTGVGSPIFGVMPSVFGLRIKNLLFTNISSAGLFCNRAGFPTVRDASVDIGGQQWRRPSVFPGTGHFSYPLLNFNYPLRSKQIFQPILGKGRAEDLPSSNDWITSHLAPDGSLASRILTQRSGKVALQSDLSAGDYRDFHAPFFSRTLRQWSLAVLQLQNHVSINGLVGETLTEHDYQERAKMASDFRALNRQWMREIRAGNIT